MAQQWKGKTRGGLLGYKIFVWFLRNLGINAAYFLLFWVSAYFIFFSPKTSVEIYKFYRKGPKFSIPKSLFYIWYNYYTLGQSLIDKVAIFIGKSKEFKLIKPNYDVLLNALKKENSYIYIMSHLGNFEAAGHLVNLDKNINILMYEAELENIKMFMNELKMESTFKPFTIKYDGSHIFELNKVFENKEILALHGDRYLEGSKTVRANFFNHPAKFTYGPFYLAKRYKADVAFITLVRSGHKQYTLEFHPLKNTEDITDIAQQYATVLQQMVEKYPNNWFNYHNFWAA